MQRRRFIKNSVGLLGALSFEQLAPFPNFNPTFDMDDVVKIKIGKVQCTVFRDLMFKYLAKDFFINANEEELNSSLLKYGITPDNIPSPFIALLVRQGDK